MRVSRTILLGALVLTVSALATQNEPPGEKSPAKRTIAASGKRTYVQYCGACHGVDAHGDGPAAAILKIPPPDPTTLSKGHDRKFPYDYVLDVLRFGTRFASHGSSDMPIWGPVLGALENYDEAATHKRIKDLCDYLASLQQNRRCTPSFDDRSNHSTRPSQITPVKMTRSPAARSQTRFKP